MKRNVNRLLSLALALVMLVGILPLVANASPTIVNNTDVDNTSAFINPKVIYQRDFDDEAVDTAIKNSTLGTLSDGYVKWVFSGGTKDSFTVNSFDPDNYGNSAKIVCDAEGATGTRQAYFEIQRSKSNAFSAEKVYRVEMDVYGLVSTVNGGFFYLTAEGASGSGGSDGNATTLKNNTKDGAWTHITYDLQPTQDHYRMRAYVCINMGLDRTIYVDNIKITEYTSASAAEDVVEAAAISGSSVILNADMDLTGNDLVLNGSALDLNGHSLTVDSLTGFAGSSLIDNSSAKSGSVIVNPDETGDINFALGSDNPQLPIKASTDPDTNAVSFKLATVNLGDEYIKQIDSSENGFTLVFRPGFGTTEFVNLVGTGDSGVSMSIDIAWTDVWGTKGTTKNSIDVAQNVISSAYSSKKAIHAKFTNPGDTYDFVITVNVTSDYGVKISSDTTQDSDATYINPAEAAKTYLFVNNFNDDALISGSGNIYSTIGNEYLVVGNARPTFNGSYMLLDGGNTANQLNLPFYFDNVSTLVMEMDLRYVDTTGLESSGYSAFDLLTLRNGTPTGTFKRYTPLYIGKSPKIMYFREYKNQVSASDTTPVTNGADLSVYTAKNCLITNVDGEWTHIKLSINYSAGEMTFEVDGVVLDTIPYIPLNSSGYAYMARYAKFDSIAIDNMKIYYTTPVAD